MTITTRSKRVSEFGVGSHTPAAVGPGSYAHESLGASYKDSTRPLFSGFATSEKRNLNANKTTSAITPGTSATFSFASEDLVAFDCVADSTDDRTWRLHR